MRVHQTKTRKHKAGGTGLEPKTIGGNRRDSTARRGYDGVQPD